MNGKEDVKRLAARFDRDHERLIHLLVDVDFLCQRGSYVAAAKVFGEYRLLQDHHLVAEEAALSQLQRDGHCPAPLAARFVGEHRQLRHLIDETWRAITCNDGGALTSSIANLVRAVGAHERSEQDELLPVLCACISDPERREREVRRLIER